MSPRQSMTSPRMLAIEILHKVLSGHSLAELLPSSILQCVDPRDQSFFRMLSYGMCRWYFQLSAVCDVLLKSPLKKKDADIRLIILCGLFQLLHTDIPSHAAVSETVYLVSCRKPWAKKLVNAVLRAFLRSQDPIMKTLEKNPVCYFSHPAWMIEKIFFTYPAKTATKLLHANNQLPPMHLRVNLLKTSRKKYLDMLAQAGITAVELPDIPCGISLTTPCEVTALPLFQQGLVSVQDGAAQFAALLLAPQKGERVLDACAAPGGKTAHLLELQPALKQLIAVDDKAERMERVFNNLRRLQLLNQETVKLIHADARTLAQTIPQEQFDAILLDAPCSASGVIRRHPDIRLLRRAEDIPALATRQHELLTALWPLLKPGGRLLYATCSVFAEENGTMIDNFMRDCKDVDKRHDKILMPGITDGFFYSLLIKKKCNACND